MADHRILIVEDSPTMRQLLAFALKRLKGIEIVEASDGMDGLRKVPDNVPNKEMLAEHLNKPLTRVPDPFGTHESFGHHNNARLCAFLDEFGFDYEFKSSTECYASGEFDAALLGVLQNYEKVKEVVLPTLGPERRATYSPFLPLCPKTGHVLQANDVRAGQTQLTGHVHIIVEVIFRPRGLEQVAGVTDGALE